MTYCLLLGISKNFGKVSSQSKAVSPLEMCVCVRVCGGCSLHLVSI